MNAPIANRLGNLQSHRWVYRDARRGHRKTVGKRIICTKRYGLQGCGRTGQLRLDNVLPNKQIDALAQDVFLVVLRAGHTVASAYAQINVKPRQERLTRRLFSFSHQEIEDFSKNSR